MRKRVKKVVSCAVFLAMVLSVSMPAGCRAREQSESGADILEELCEQEAAEQEIDEETLEKQDELNETYSEIEDAMTVSETTDEDGTEVVYEDEYAGSYLEGDTLVVCMTQEQDEDVCGDTENVECRIVEHSYNELSEVQDKLSEMYPQLYERYADGSPEKELLSAISGFGVDEECNAVVVEIVGLDAEKRELFGKLFGEREEIVLRPVEAKAEECSTYCPGKGIYVITKRVKKNITYAVLSIGYRAYRKTKKGKQYGFVTAGHGCMDSIDKNVYVSTKSNKVIGKIKKYQYSGSVDACFVEIDKQHLVGTTTQYSNVLGETKNGDRIAKGCYMKSVSKGSRVYKVGVTTYRTAATVKNTKWVETFNKTIFTNLTRTRCFCDDGDSGGLVYTQHKGEYVPAGIIKGTSKDGKFSYYIKATEIVSALGAYPY